MDYMLASKNWVCHSQLLCGMLMWQDCYTVASWGGLFVGHVNVHSMLTEPGNAETVWPKTRG